MVKLFMHVLGLCVSMILLFSCTFSSEISRDSRSKINAGDYGSIVDSTSVFSDEDGNLYASFSVNTVNNYVKDSRSILPSSMNLYFSVTASTVYKGQNSSVTWDSSIDADSSVDALASGASVAVPYYASSVNSMTGLTLTLKVGQIYYITVYGTETSPASFSAAEFYGDRTSDSPWKTEYTDQQKTLIGLSTSDTDYDTYCAYRAAFAEFFSDNAVVKGTVKVYVGTDSSGSICFKEEDENGDELTALIIPTSSAGITGVGRPVFIFDIPATYRDSEGTTDEECAAYSLTNQNKSIHSVQVRWTAKNKGVNGSFVYDVSAYKSTGKVIEFKPYAAAGEYDIDLSFLNSSGDDIFTLHDSMVIWKNQRSYVYGTGSYYSSTSVIAEIALDGTSSDAEAALVADSVQSLELGSVTASGAISYTVIASQILSFSRQTFYVSGSGGVLTADSDTANGSLQYPYACINDALSAISSYRAAGYDDGTINWQIIIDGTETVPTVINFTNSMNTDLCITIRNFASERVGITKSASFVNASSTAQFNLYLTNVDWTVTNNNYTFVLGTDTYISNTALASDINSPAAGKGYVNLNVEEDGISRAGILYMDASSDISSTVMNIQVVDSDTSTNTIYYGHNILSYKYHAAGSLTYTSGNFISVNPKARFALSTTFKTLGVNSSVTNNIIDADRTVGSETYGCEILKSLHIYTTTGLSFSGTHYSGSVKISDNYYIVSDGNLENSGVITLTVNVTSDDYDAYPVDALEDYLALSSAGGSLDVSVIGENETVEESFIVDAPVSGTAGSGSSYNYFITVTLPETLASQTASGTDLSSGNNIFYLYVTFDLGYSDPTEVDGIFRLTIYK